jgi:hypothetical protein
MPRERLAMSGADRHAIIETLSTEEVAQRIVGRDRPASWPRP